MFDNTKEIKKKNGFNNNNESDNSIKEKENDKLINKLNLLPFETKDNNFPLSSRR